ncbi:MAG: hypothetical protein LBM98_05510 [Oscillospiraceae bacterium]|jgi:hypothetical protein|nr:hypothetical protein [Oscillospiraceae bacterium]
MPNTVTVQGTTYTVEKVNGRLSLLRYNEKYKTWVKLNFTATSEPNTIRETLISQYLRENA